ncbi:MAG: YajQ family cyclic di-GMP-binding protein [Alteromonadaceae bacterium]|nr:YajQ family cyclic di-GMP-binding protein [Alteromonadaceae bacterium]
MPSLDIVSETDLEEVRNAIQNASRELTTRFDFRGVDASFEWKSPAITVKAEADFQLTQMQDILRTQLAKRKIDAKAMTIGNAVHTGKTFSQQVTFAEGIEQPVAKKIVKLIKDAKLKVQASIQGEQVRVTGKKRDDLQAVMQLIREADLEQSFQFNNFRD